LLFNFPFPVSFRPNFQQHDDINNPTESAQQ
jgi:hypothetical protein